MSRSSVLIYIAGSVCLVVSVAATVWFVLAPHEARQQATTAPHRVGPFDTTGGQVMQPHWSNRQGEGDGTSQN